MVKYTQEQLAEMMEESKREVERRSQFSDMFSLTPKGEPKSIKYRGAAEIFSERLEMFRIGEIHYYKNIEGNFRPTTYSGGESFQGRIETLLGKYNTNLSFSTHNIKEIYKAIIRLSFESPRYEEFKMEQFNGLVKTPTKIFSIDELSIEDNTDIFSNLRFPNTSEYEYNQQARKIEIVDTVLDRITSGDEEIKTLILEMIGSTFVTDLKWLRLFNFYGDGDNGKSTLKALIEKLHGLDNTSSIAINDFKEKFSPTYMIGKQVNFAGDVDDVYIENTGKIKSFTGGDTASFEIKFGGVHQTKLYAQQFFNSNHEVRSKDKSVGWKRRLIIIPMNFVPTKKMKQDWDKEEKILHSRAGLEYLFKISLEAFQKVIKRGEFTIGKNVEKTLAENRTVNEPLLQFEAHMNDISDEYESLDHLVESNGGDKEKVYSSYKRWYDNKIKRNGNPESFHNFKRNFTKLFPRFENYKTSVRVMGKDLPKTIYKWRVKED